MRFHHGGVEGWSWAFQWPVPVGGSAEGVWVFHLCHVFFRLLAPRGQGSLGFKNPGWGVVYYRPGCGQSWIFGVFGPGDHGGLRGGAPREGLLRFRNPLSRTCKQKLRDVRAKVWQPWFAQKRWKSRNCFTLEIENQVPQVTLGALMQSFWKEQIQENSSVSWFF